MPNLGQSKKISAECGSKVGSLAVELPTRELTGSFRDQVREQARHQRRWAMGNVPSMLWKELLRDLRLDCDGKGPARLASTGS